MHGPRRLIEETESGQAVAVGREELLLGLGPPFLRRAGLGLPLGLADDRRRGLRDRRVGVEGVVEEDRSSDPARGLAARRRGATAAHRARDDARGDGAELPRRATGDGDRRHPGGEHERHHEQAGERQAGAGAADELPQRRGDEAAEPAAAVHDRPPLGDEPGERRERHDEEPRARDLETRRCLGTGPQQRDGEVAEIDGEEIRGEAERVQRRVGDRVPDRPAEVRVRGVGRVGEQAERQEHREGAARDRLRLADQQARRARDWPPAGRALPPRHHHPPRPRSSITSP